MSNIYENVLAGLQEAIDDSVGEKKTLKRHMVAILHVLLLRVGNIIR